ncbi:unnamed protein product [Gongylonema pulchrum]|uniref:Thioredoxin domain-containing protein n=1 Tax=Gongylonema pulchrum TaxID=637853 RepID=A0A183DYL9_9BILA|nr:unnamed protein product [Gongylonema pulchrum]
MLTLRTRMQFRRGSGARRMFCDEQRQSLIFNIEDEEDFTEKGSGARRMFCDEQRQSLIFNIEGEEDFTEKVLRSSVPVLVDFYADWCGPCKMLGPRIEAKVLGRQGTVMLAKVNVDYAADLAMDYEVNAVPTVLAVRDGEVTGRFEGVQNDEELDQFIEDLLNLGKFWNWKTSEAAAAQLKIDSFEVMLAKVNVDYAADLAMDYEVNAVPTVLAVRDGEVTGRFEGVQNDEELDQFIEDLVGSEG